MNIFAWALTAQVVLILMKLTEVSSWPWVAIFIPVYVIVIATILDTVSYLILYKEW